MAGTIIGVDLLWRMYGLAMNGPMFFEVLPIKTVILLMQFSGIFYETHGLHDCFGCFVSTVFFIRIVLIALSFIVFIGYLFDQKTIMKTHLWSTIFFLAIPVAIFQIVVCCIICWEIGHEDDIEVKNIVRQFLFSGSNYFCSILAKYIFYLWMCHTVIRALDKKLEATSSTTN